VDPLGGGLGQPGCVLHGQQRLVFGRSGLGHQGSPGWSGTRRA
jgi:hypothetical protein